MIAFDPSDRPGTSHLSEILSSHPTPTLVKPAPFHCPQFDKCKYDKIGMPCSNPYAQNSPCPHELQVVSDAINYH